MQTKLEQIYAELKSKLECAKSSHEINNIKSAFVGKKSQISSLLLKMKELPKEQRPEFGKLVNVVKGKILTKIKSALEVVESEQRGAEVDLTMPSRRRALGRLHPLNIVSRQIEDVFISMGFEISSYGEVEDEYHNFDALNTPADHSSRNITDTFYTNGGKLLRSQTSTEQIRVMENFKPPIKIISLGRCYRKDSPDASHSPVFHQVEALVVSRHTSFTDLRDTLQMFATKMFGADVSSRFRPHFFPFTEPSGEIDISCVACGGKGCPVCKNSGWLEMGGCGMVDPNVLENVGIDSEKYTGFAFGLGIDRITMLKYKIPDIRTLFENDIEFLKQF